MAESDNSGEPGNPLVNPSNPGRPFGIPKANPSIQSESVGSASQFERAFDSDLEAYASGYFDSEWEIVPVSSVITPSLPSSSPARSNRVEHSPIDESTAGVSSPIQTCPFATDPVDVPGLGMTDLFGLPYPELVGPSAVSECSIGSPSTPVWSDTQGTLEHMSHDHDTEQSL